VSAYQWIYLRIAERVNRRHATDFDSYEIEAVVEGHAHSPIREDLEREILDEAREYGVPVQA
jgi:UDP-2,3-diacylglucosamine pyrophosphatase LpxH